MRSREEFSLKTDALRYLADVLSEDIAATPDPKILAEEGDDSALVKKAVSESSEFLSKLGTKRVMLYPFAHLSQNLAKPADALKLLLEMEVEAKSAGLQTMSL